MNEKLLLVEHLSDINNVIKNTFQPMQRIKLTCFDSSPHLLVFGATSGGIYIFKKDPCVFLKLIPSKEGSAMLVAISEGGQYIGVATSKGLIFILDQFLEDSSNQYQVFSEHEGNNVTYIKWRRNELYVGDEAGKVSVVTATYSSGFQTKAMLQIPAASLMTLDSEIIQIDTFESYVLISTKTKTFLCDTEKETYMQVGKKLRDGSFGACFCHHNGDSLESIIKETSHNPCQSVIENESCKSLNTKIYCARPGARIWEAGYDAKVLVTYQFKSSLDVAPTNYLIIDSKEESTMQKKQYSKTEKVHDNFNFQKIYPLCDKFILTYDSERVYIFDPISSKLIFWTNFLSSIRNVAVINNTFYVWKNDLEIGVFSVMDLENLLLTTLYNKQYLLCADLCIAFTKELLLMLEDSKKLYLLSVLKNKILNQEVVKKIQPVLDKVNSMNAIVFTRKQIVTVDNLYTNGYEETHRKTNKDTNKYLKLLMKQYQLNKTHSQIDIPEVADLLKSVTPNEIYLILNGFLDYVTTELKEDSKEWCQNQFLKQIFDRNITVKDLNLESVNMLTEAVIKSNESQNNLSCRCGYPLPKCHKHLPNYYNIIIDIFNNYCGHKDKLQKFIPYLWKHKIKTEPTLNIPGLIQFSDLELLKEHTLELSYDSWHDIIGYFIKLNEGLCLNCGERIDLQGLINWSDLAKVIVWSLGAKNAIRILQKYDSVIPKGALNVDFYYSCIFAHSFMNRQHETKVDAEAMFKFLNSNNETESGCRKLNDLMIKYFKRKHSENRNFSFHYTIETEGVCSACNLPLKNDFFYECKSLKTCSHKFHMFCFERNNRVCSICK
ncbi:BLOC-2 complex member HPS5 homolog isoform X2 [Anthonomus grandis grandis]|uniref:BLOC-2 complex member HPS5 homolog isoform X2 n=1 Tax=Anthonomus grandis grandis TaxID=2921223 RepID=UPI002166B0F0|nr:BLOC-2 complex member HPS5 homolog isoform X2 [Anthonomus grandis grandis]